MQMTGVDPTLRLLSTIGAPPTPTATPVMSTHVLSGGVRRGWYCTQHEGLV